MQQVFSGEQLSNKDELEFSGSYSTVDTVGPVLFSGASRRGHLFQTKLIVGISLSPFE